ncbi:hypothetical protein A3K73_03625 [Candidatus Pacearchaeota archaeon RBG_13_36_9]|nr:MAG: hypothetical protein A3K73_03625 [Candidatus Pacearchaeota archaeon RBG_13_36_9]
MNEQIKQHIENIDPNLADAYYHAIQILRKIQPPFAENLSGYDRALAESYNPWEEFGTFSTRVYSGLTSHLMEQGGYRQNLDGPIAELFKMNVSERDREILKKLNLEQQASILALASIMKGTLHSYSYAFFVPFVLENEERWRDACLENNHAHEIMDTIEEYFGKNPLTEMPDKFLEHLIGKKLIGGSST